MKKIITCALASVLLAGSAASLAALPQKASAAEGDNAIKALAQYEFDDANNLGKDSSGNGFHLTVKDTSASSDAEKGVSYGSETEGLDEIDYVKLRRTGTDDALRGGILYAPFFAGTSDDFSDIVTGSFSLSMRFRAVDIPAGNGSYYLLQTSRYNNAIGVTPWSDSIEVFTTSDKGAPRTEADPQGWTQSCGKKSFPANVDIWNTLTIVGDQSDNKVYVYLNGNLETIADLGAMDATTYLSSGDINRYTFCLGGQCEGQGGNASTMYGSGDIDFVRVYDVALSAENVARLYNGEDAVSEAGTEYVAEIEEIDYSDYDFLVTDRNTIADIKSSLPSSVNIVTSSGTKKKASVYWYETENEVRGYLQVKNLSNDRGLMYSHSYGYTVRLTYDSALITVKDVRLDGEPLAVGTDLGKIRGGTLTFAIEPNNGVTVNGFYFEDLDWEPDELYDADDDLYYVDITGAVDIEIYASVKQGTITYYDGEEKLGTSKYSMGGSEELKTFEKEGYEFVGWYTDAELKTPFAGLDYTDPVNITLYASYRAVGGNTNGGKKGCAGNLAAGASLFICLGAVAVASAIVLKKKKGQ